MIFFQKYFFTSFSCPKRNSILFILEVHLLLLSVVSIGKKWISDKPINAVRKLSLFVEKINWLLIPRFLLVLYDIITRFNKIDIDRTFISVPNSYRRQVFSKKESNENAYLKFFIKSSKNDLYLINMYIEQSLIVE